jgi:hypothetical protein
MRYIDDHKAGPLIGVIHINNHPLDLLWKAWRNSAYGTGWEETCWRGGGAVFVKWSGKFRQRAKMYPALTTGYRNDDKTQFFGQVQGHGCA